MTLPTILTGNQFDLFRETDVADTFAFFCVASSLSWETTVEYDSSAERDCADRSKLAVTVRTPKNTTHRVTFSGRASGAAHAMLMADVALSKANTPRRYRFMLDETAENGGGTFTAAVEIDTKSIQKQDNGQVTFNLTGQFRGDPDFVAAA
jgi:hypothetical protein